VQFGGEK
jgi:hypothetical protein